MRAAERGGGGRKRGPGDEQGPTLPRQPHRSRRLGGTDAVPLPPTCFATAFPPTDKPAVHGTTCRCRRRCRRPAHARSWRALPKDPAEAICPTAHCPPPRTPGSTAPAAQPSPTSLSESPQPHGFPFFSFPPRGAGLAGQGSSCAHTYAAPAACHPRGGSNHGEQENQHYAACPDICTAGAVGQTLSYRLSPWKEEGQDIRDFFRPGRWPVSTA